MIDPNLVHRRSMIWLWWLLGALLAGGLLWFGASQIGGDAADLRSNPDSLQAPARTAAPAGSGG